MHVRAYFELPYNKHFERDWFHMNYRAFLKKKKAWNILAMRKYVEEIVWDKFEYCAACIVKISLFSQPGLRIQANIKSDPDSTVKKNLIRIRIQPLTLSM